MILQEYPGVCERVLQALRCSMSFLSTGKFWYILGLTVTLQEGTGGCRKFQKDSGISTTYIVTVQEVLGGRKCFQDARTLQDFPGLFKMQECLVIYRRLQENIDFRRIYDALGASGSFHVSRRLSNMQEDLGGCRKQNIALGIPVMLQDAVESS